MDSSRIEYCTCGWSGIAHIKHIYEKVNNNIYPDLNISHTESYHCKSCAKELKSVSKLIYNSDLRPEQKQDLGIKPVPMPYVFSTDKYKMTIMEGEFIIYSKDITDTTRTPNSFKSNNRVECIGEVFYQAIFCPIITGSSFKVEYIITDNENDIDAFCEYFLEHFTVKKSRNKIFPRTKPAPWNIPTTVPSIPNPYKSPAPPFDPNQIPWASPIPNKKPMPYTYPMPKKIDPYATDEDISEKYRKKIEEILQKQKDDEDNKSIWDNFD